MGQADIQFSVSVRNDNVQQCKAQHDAIITKLNAYLMANEYPKGILSLEGTLLQRQRRQSSKLVEDFYLAKSTYSMRTDRIEDLSTLQADIVEIGVDEIEFVRLFSSEQRVLEDQARKLALDDAKAKAALTADELEWKLDKPIKVNYTNSPWSGQSRGFGSRGGHVQAAPIATSANFVDVVVQLTYSYRIDEKPAQ